MTKQMIKFGGKTQKMVFPTNFSVLNKKIIAPDNTDFLEALYDNTDFMEAHSLLVKLIIYIFCRSLLPW